jgi:membrane-bound lytic murein transglycosylase D
MILPPENKNQKLVIQVVETDDSFLVQFLTFLASVSLVVLSALLVLIFWARPAFLETVSAPTRDLLHQFKQNLGERAVQALHLLEPPETVATEVHLPAPNPLPSFMTADDMVNGQVKEDLGKTEPLDAITPNSVLDDPLNRISEDFKVPAALKPRVAFWFDIYTRYTSLFHILHHDRYPWIIFKVVDTTPFMSTKGPEWLRRDRGNRAAHREQAQIEATLIRMSKLSDFSALTEVERDLYEKLKLLPGPRRKVFRMAAASIRDQLGQRDFFINGLRNSARYLPYMEETFRQRNVPVELTRLPFVESSFNEKAESRVGASGIWQIMPQTGRAYLIVNDTIDERNAPLKATRVAAYIFHSYNHVLKSWPLTVTSYNHGIGNIQIAIRRAQSRDLPTIIERYHDGDFKFASSNFFTCFLAALHAEKYQEIVFPTVAKSGLREREVVQISRRLRIDQVMRLAGIDRDQLLDYNLDLQHAVLHKAFLPKGYELHLPPGAKERLLIGLNESQPLAKPVAARKQTAQRADGNVKTSTTAGST